ncbi:MULTISPECIES: Pr6Pr family membrane protein [Arthrobacter]|uniref:Pr6Pr family membrane protein n=2 Tax=Arthrobacter TaxID=1663 RepID=A0ABU9KN61_9MICC|nr:Pr6Pr family membrane protein [Arthrobacter sp. YJM1]MDP5227612.1 Pr6Pr family membrane protein [Arthrobacter sp. YJM1]
MTSIDVTRRGASVNRGLALFRAFFALLGLAALTAQLVELVGRAGADKVGNFFSYFTIQSNIIVVLALALAAAAAWRGETSRRLDFLRGASTVYISITGVVYSLLLTDIDVNVPLPWVNVALHYTLPTIAAIDWLVDLPRPCIRLRGALLWLIYPALYLVYSLVRGPIVDWYPYPFLDPRTSGYGPVLVMSLVIAVAAFVFVAVAALSTKLAEPRRRRVDA